MTGSAVVRMYTHSQILQSALCARWQYYQDVAIINFRTSIGRECRSVTDAIWAQCREEVADDDGD